MQEEEQKEIPYKGNEIPKILKFVYVIFILWAVYYFVSNGMPDLSEWLK